MEKSVRIELCCMGSLEVLGTFQKWFASIEEATNWLKTEFHNSSYIWLMPNGYYTDEIMAYKIIDKKEER